MAEYITARSFAPRILSQYLCQETWLYQYWLTELILTHCPWGYAFDIKYVIFKHVLVITFRSISNAVAFSCEAQDLTDSKLILIQVMTWWTWTTGNVDLGPWCNMASLGHNELMSLSRTTQK